MPLVRCKVLHAQVGGEVEIDASIFEFFRTDTGCEGHLSDDCPPNIILAEEGIVLIIPFVRPDGLIESQLRYLVPRDDDPQGPLLQKWHEGRAHGRYPTFAEVTAAYDRASETVLNRSLN